MREECLVSLHGALLESLHLKSEARRQLGLIHVCGPLIPRYVQGATLHEFGGWLFWHLCKGALRLELPYSHTTPSPSAPPCTET